MIAPLVLILRPEPGASATARRCAERGLPCRVVPLFAIAPIAWRAPDVSGFDALLMTSANAVEQAGPGLTQLKDLPCWCVGNATARAAERLGLRVVHIGSSGVQALVHAAPPARLLWLAGVDHTTLRAPPGIDLTIVPVYRSAVVAVDAARLTGATMALLHSARAARRLAEIAPDRAALTLITLSGAVAEAAGSGWRAVHIASRPEDSEMVEIAAKLCQKRRQHVKPDRLRDHQG